MRRHKRRLILLNEEIKNLIENKKKAYLWYLATRSETDKLEYKRIVVIVKREKRKVKRQCWETFVSGIEHDLHGRQIKIYKIIRNLSRTEKGNLRLNPIVEHTWLVFFYCYTVHVVESLKYHTNHCTYIKFINSHIKILKRSYMFRS